MQKPPKKTQKSPHPFGHLPASYRPAIGQLSASYKKTEDANESHPLLLWWALTDSNRRPSACKADALNQLS